MDKEIQKIIDETETQGIEIRSSMDAGSVSYSDDNKSIYGYAAKFNSFSQDLGGFREIIRPGSFDRCLAAGADVRAFINHAGIPLARTKSGTLKLTVDPVGLRYEIPIMPDTEDSNTVISALKRGDMDGSSFAFTIPNGGDKWRKEGTQVIRELHDVDLKDVSVVTSPAYLATTAHARNMALATAEPTAYTASITLFSAMQKQREAELKR